MFKLVCALAYLSALSAATPFALEERALPACSAVPTVKNRLSRCATATKFCQSFLRSSTTRPVVVTTSTSTITRSITATSRPRTTEFTTTLVETSPTSTVSTSTSTATDTATCPAIAVQTGSAPSKRDLSLEARARDPKPSCGVRDQPIRDVQAGCSCLLFPTSTIRARTTTRTTVTTTTITSTIQTDTTTTTTPLTTASTVENSGACPTPQTCGNQGLNWAYKRYNSDHNDAAFYYDREPEASGTTSDLGNFGPGTSNFYGSAQSSENFWFEHTTYIFAPQTGTYNFRFIDLDDNGLLWVGQKAYNTFTNANADLQINTVDIGTPRAAFDTMLEQGSYTPFRLIWVQGVSVGYLHFEVTAPNGELIMSSYDNGATTPAYLVTSSCDDTSAPDFPPFNNEGPPATPVCEECTCPATQLQYSKRELLSIIELPTCDADCPRCQVQEPSCPEDCTCPATRVRSSKRSPLSIIDQPTCDADCPACQNQEPNCPSRCTCFNSGRQTRTSLARRFSGPILKFCDDDCPACNVEDEEGGIEIGNGGEEDNDEGGDEDVDEGNDDGACSDCTCPDTLGPLNGAVCDATCRICTG